MFLSAFDLYRIGPGPSSAHTVGPMRAARRFVHELEADGVFFQTAGVHVDLFGSVACTARDQATDAAIVAGLCGDTAESAAAGRLPARVARIRADGRLPLGDRAPIAFDPDADITCHVDKTFAWASNGLRFTARNARGEVVATRLYHSTGAGQIVAEGEAPAAGAALRVPFPFTSAAQVLHAGAAQGKRLADMVRTNELALRSPGEVVAGMVRFGDAMRAAVLRGLAAEGTLPGSLALPRRAAARAAALAGTEPTSPEWAAVYAMAVAEENAAGGRVVAAPANGAAGPVAGVWHQWRTTTTLAGDDGTATFLLAAAGIAQLLRQGGLRHSGCQGEVGVASAMAAGGLAAVLGGSNSQVVFAAERALEPHLGMTCDPLAGLVQQPCIERNAAAAIHAVKAARLAVRQPEPARVALDALVRSMVAAGQTMTSRYKESSLGGLAVNVVDC